MLKKIILVSLLPIFIVNLCAKEDLKTRVEKIKKEQIIVKKLGKVGFLNHLYSFLGGSLQQIFLEGLRLLIMQKVKSLQ